MSQILEIAKNGAKDKSREYVRLKYVQAQNAIRNMKFGVDAYSDKLNVLLFELLPGNKAAFTPEIREAIERGQ